jgi:four helix bundle protein
VATFKKFEDIEVWKKARTLANLVFKELSNENFNKDKKLKYQMLGSSGSIMDNIAEGQARGGNKEFKQFLWSAKGSSAELRSQNYRSQDRNFISKDSFDDLYERANEIEKMIKGLINHIEKSEIRGIKYK